MSTLLAHFMNKLFQVVLVRKIAFLRDVDGQMTQLVRPINMALMGWIWMLGLYDLAFPKAVLLVVSVLAKSFTYAGVVWAGMRFSDVVEYFLAQKAIRTPNKLDDLLAPLVGRSLKVFVGLIGVVSVAELFNLPITSLLTGLGIGGIAIAMAAKDTIANIFGSLTVVMDRPFHIGDWVVIGEVEGTVEQLGFRSTRVRTFYNSVVSIPNSTLITAQVDNMGARRYRRLKMTLGLTYDTPPDKIEAFCAGIRDLISKTAAMRQDYYEVHFNAYNASSLDVLVYAFFETKDWSEELKARHIFLIEIKHLAASLGVEFAYPTQTLHLEGLPQAS